MPETTYLNLNTDDIKKDCEKVILLADEYLHDELLGLDLPEISREPELSEEDRSFIQKHISECKECFDYIETERKNLEAIRLAEYIPEISVSQSVMDRIIDNVMTVEKPPKRRFVPVGFISAAAVVIIIALSSRGSPIDFFKDIFGQSNEKSDTTTPETAMDGGGALGGEEIFASPVIPGGFGDEINESGDTAMGFEAANGSIESDDDNDDIPVPGLMKVNDPPEETDETTVSTKEDPQSMEEYVSARSDIEISEFYEFYYIDSTLTEIADITTDIEIYWDNELNDTFYVIEKKYKDILDKNLTENNIAVYETVSQYQDGKYIAVLFWSLQSE